MPRYPQKPDSHGSLYLIQRTINSPQRTIDNAIREAIPALTNETFTSLSPLEEDEFAEYRDQAFLDRLGIEVEIPLAEFWPQNGPQWDAFATASDGSVILVEAKANVEEFVSSPCGAKDEASLAMIRSAFTQLGEGIKLRPGSQLDGPFYQYFNRLAHLYYLREINSVSAYLVFAYFYGDKVDGKLCPSTSGEWRAAIRTFELYFGLGQDKLSPYTADVFLSTGEMVG